MSRNSTLVDEATANLSEGRNEMAGLRTQRQNATDAGNAPAPSANPGLGQRIKNALAKIFEGNHDFHNYLGG
jgi:hypothetical protein